VTSALPALIGHLPEALRADVLDLTALYYALTDAKQLHVQLSLVGSDKCKRFHVDNIRLRLLCTYVGPGTQWVPEAFVNRAAVYDCECPAHRDNAALVPDMSRVRQVPTAAVAILKGEAFAGNAGKGIIHRSPSIESEGQQRLVLTIDDFIPL
jgi:hypothetical protein